MEDFNIVQNMGIALEEPDDIAGVPYDGYSTANFFVSDGKTIKKLYNIGTQEELENRLAEFEQVTGSSRSDWFFRIATDTQVVSWEIFKNWLQCVPTIEELDNYLYNMNNMMNC